jgi:hypothetical protein
MKDKMIHRKRDFIQSTKWPHLLILILLVLSSILAACSPGSTGSSLIGFVRDGTLWTVDPNGANAFAIVGSGPRVIDFSWSPTHQLLAYRTLDPDFAKSVEGRLLKLSPLSGSPGDVPGELNTLGVDGGTPLPLAFSSPKIRYSDPTWINNGSRLLYRVTPLNPAGSFQGINWYISQNDQPGGIARKPLPASYAFPSSSYESANYHVLGYNDNGVFSSTLDGKQVNTIAETTLAGHPLPATLERILWRPGQKDQEFLYAETVPTFAPQVGDALVVQLVLRSLTGKRTALTSCQCKQFAWSPDGRYVLFGTDQGYSLLNVQTKAIWEVPVYEQSIPYWSPDGQFLLIDGEHTLQLLTPASKQQQILLSDGHTNQSPPENLSALPSPEALLNAVSNSPWSTDSRHLLFLTRDRVQWQGQALTTGPGLYTATVNDKGQIQDRPALTAQGKITQAGWTYQDANTSFLY